MVKIDYSDYVGDMKMRYLVLRTPLTRIELRRLRWSGHVFPMKNTSAVLCPIFILYQSIIQFVSQSANQSECKSVVHSVRLPFAQSVRHSGSQ